MARNKQTAQANSELLSSSSGTERKSTDVDHVPQTHDGNKSASKPHSHAAILTRSSPQQQQQQQQAMANTAFLTALPLPQQSFANTAFLTALPPAQSTASDSSRKRVHFPYNWSKRHHKASVSNVDHFPSDLTLHRRTKPDLLTPELVWQAPLVQQSHTTLPLFPAHIDLSNVPFLSDAETWTYSEQQKPRVAQKNVDYHIGSTKEQSETPVVAAFAYPRLQRSARSIRLLRIDPVVESADASLYCTLVSIQPWTSSESYECLSYCWGDASATRPIFVRAASDANYQPISVTRNLHNALRRLRRTHVSRYLWVDALCINQQDLDERSLQVAMMKDIYKRASGILIWLGESTNSLSAAVMTIKAITKRFQEDTSKTPESIVGPSGLCLTSEDIERLKTYTSISPDYAYRLVAHFFSLPYFRRVWVLQEVFSQSQVLVHLGDHVLPWGASLLAALWQSCFTRTHTATTASDFRGLDAKGYLPELWLGLLHTRAMGGLPMIELVSRARDFEASDSRDRIFGLLGLANDLDVISHRSTGLRPDYTKSKVDVFASFARGLIFATQSLDVLTLVDTFSHKAEDMDRSSWVPDIDVPIATIRGLGFPRKYNASLSASVDTEIFSRPSMNARTLYLSGFVLSRVQLAVPVPLKFARDLKLYMNQSDAIMNLWINFVRPFLLPHHSSEEALLRRYIELLTAAGFAMPTEFPEYPLGQVIPSRAVPSIMADFAAYWSFMEPNFISFTGICREALLQQAGVGDADQFGVLAGKACHERKFMVTADGRMGLCPRSTLIGDVIVILYGGSVPYILREDGQGKFSFVGECYVDGVMFGEAMELREDGKVFSIV